MEKIVSQPLLDPGQTEALAPVVLPCVLEIVQKIENYSEASNLGNRGNIVKESGYDSSTTCLTKEKKVFPRIANALAKVQESPGDKAEPANDENRLDTKAKVAEENVSKLPFNTLDAAKPVINKTNLSSDSTDAKESNGDTESSRKLYKYGQNRIPNNDKHNETNYRCSSAKRKYRRSRSCSQQKTLFQNSLFKNYYSSLKKCFRNVLKSTTISSNRGKRVAFFLRRKYPKRTTVRNSKVRECNIRKEETQLATRRSRKKRNLQIGASPYGDFSDESSGLERKETWRGGNVPKRQKHFTDRGIRHRRQRMKRHIVPVKIVASSTDETPVAKTSSEEVPVHAHTAIVESVNDVGYIRGHRSSAEVLRPSETIIEEFVRGKRRKKMFAPRVYLFGVPKRIHKMRNYEYYSDGDSILCLSDEENIISSEVQRGKKYYMKQIKSHSRSVFKIPGSWIRKFKKMCKFEHNHGIYCDDERACDSSDVIVIRQPKYNIHEPSSQFVCKECAMRKRETLLNDPFVYNVTDASAFSKENVECKKNDVENKEASNGSMMNTLSVPRKERKPPLDNILNKLIGYNGFEYHHLNCKCDGCRNKKTEDELYNRAQIRSCSCKHCKNYNCYSTKNQEHNVDIKAQNVCQCYRCVDCERKDVKGTMRRFIFYEREFPKMPPPKEFKKPCQTVPHSNSSEPIKTPKNEDSPTQVESDKGKNSPIEAGVSEMYYLDEKECNVGSRGYGFASRTNRNCELNRQNFRIRPNRKTKRISHYTNKDFTEKSQPIKHLQ